MRSTDLIDKQAKDKGAKEGDADTSAAAYEQVEEKIEADRVQREAEANQSRGSASHAAAAGQSASGLVDLIGIEP